MADPYLLNLLKQTLTVEIPGLSKQKEKRADTENTTKSKDNNPYVNDIGQTVKPTSPPI
jgi:hypothetical protein